MCVLYHQKTAEYVICYLGMKQIAKKPYSKQTTLWTHLPLLVVTINTKYQQKLKNESVKYVYKIRVKNTNYHVSDPARQKRDFAIWNISYKLEWHHRKKKLTIFSQFFNKTHIKKLLYCIWVPWLLSPNFLWLRSPIFN